MSIPLLLSGSTRFWPIEVSRSVSEPMNISTGAPQGCVSSPLYCYSHYTLMNVHAVLATISWFSSLMIQLFCYLLSGASDVVTYKHEVQNCVQWCDKHFLSINTKKTVEMMLDPKSTGDHSTVVINGQNIAQVDIHIDNKLTWVQTFVPRSNSVCTFFDGWESLVSTRKCCFSFTML